jgi:hypothetical protein
MGVGSGDEDAVGGQSDLLGDAGFDGVADIGGEHAGIDDTEGDGFGAGFQDEGAGVEGVVHAVGQGLEEAAVADGGEFERGDVGGGGAGVEGIGGQTRELKSEIRKEEEKERGVPEHGSQTDASCAGLRA